MPHRLALVENNQALLQRLVETITRFDDFSVIASHSQPQEALRALPGIRPDVVLMDIQMSPVDGISCVARLKPRMPETEFVMLTAFGDSERVFGALAAGASGYLMKSASSDELHAALRDVVAGGVPLDADVARKIIQSFRVSSPGDEPLSKRESDVLTLLSQGMLYKEIAEELGVGYSTVNSHVKQIYRKLRVNSRDEAVRRHQQAGL